MVGGERSLEVTIDQDSSLSGQQRGLLGGCETRVANRLLENGGGDVEAVACDEDVGEPLLERRHLVPWEIGGRDGLDEGVRDRFHVGVAIPSKGLGGFDEGLGGLGGFGRGLGRHAEA